MLVRNEHGREIEISIYGGSIDNIQIDEAHYVDGAPDEFVPDSDLEYIMAEYADAIYMEWLEIQIGRAEDYADLLADR